MKLALPQAPDVDRFTIDQFRRSLALIMIAELDHELDQKAQASLVLRGAFSGIAYDTMEDVRVEVVEQLLTPLTE